MHRLSRTFLAACLLIFPLLATAAPPLPRRLPPPGIEIPPERAASWKKEIAALQAQLDNIEHPLKADAEVYVKAVALALRHGEFYHEKDFAKADAVLVTAVERIAQLIAGSPDWPDKTGLLVRGYRSSIDGSAQPYGLLIPDNHDSSRPAPLYVWLHGRGDKTTDLHFIRQRETSRGQIAPPGAIVLHPFGRQCIGFKSAGEIDVLEAVAHVSAQYAIDPNRIVLMGFSMGGAGAWHVGAHYTDRWAAVSPGAGFAETARYNRLQPENYPPSYEQTLWGLYDAPDYVRNFFNVPTVAYSGEKDKQIQAARIMEQAFAEEGGTLTHLIGPGMGHRYHPDTLKNLLSRMAAAARQGRNTSPERIWLQTRTLRYPRMHWAAALRLKEHWQDSRIDAERNEQGIRITTKNIAALRIGPAAAPAKNNILIDGQTLPPPTNMTAPVLVLRGEKWGFEEYAAFDVGLAKRPGLQGPIGDVFMAPFLVVTPTGKAANPQMQQWVEFELTHFRDRWRALFRGELREKTDQQVTDQDIKKYHLILWGDPQSNLLLKRINQRLPIRWEAGQVRVGERTFDAAHHAPAFIYPNPENPRKYVVINSGPTFREAHDRTNSLQNPKLPDWAVIDLRQPPSVEAPGGIAAADFFDERWRLKATGVKAEK